MGLCISSSAHKIQDGHEAPMSFERSEDSNGIQMHGSLYSLEGSKGVNQDSAILYQGYGLEAEAFCGVFDGHGRFGHQVSQLVRSNLPSLLQGQMKALDQQAIAVAEDDDSKNHIDRIETESEDSEPSKKFHKWKEAFVSSFKVMDKEIKLQENLDSSCSGTTAVVVIKQGEDLFIANLGDSRAVLGTTIENGIEAIQLTTDLKPALPSEAERIRACDGRVVALKQEPNIQRVWLPHIDLPGLAMSRAFGDFILKDHGIIATPDVSYRRLTSKDRFVVLATDGVWDVLSNSEVASIVWEADSAQAAAKAVTETAVATWRRKFPSAKIDDCTVVCLFLQDKLHDHVVPVKI
ncbi:unnamed protein product [Prunus brigantina]